MSTLAHEVPTDGGAAFRRHYKAAACPFRADTPERYRWLAEWHEALAKFCRENRKPADAERADRIARGYRQQVGCAALSLQPGDGR